MFIVFDMRDVEYCKTWNEVEADAVAAQIGGYYVESGRIEIAQKIYKTLCKLTIAFMLVLW